MPLGRARHGFCLNVMGHSVVMPRVVLAGSVCVLGAVSLQWAFLGLFVALAGAACAGGIAMSHLVGPRRAGRGKLAPYECGVPLLGETRQRFSVKFYLVAIFFMLFDIEAVFLIPWALGKGSFAAGQAAGAYLLVLVFVVVLTLALVYLWKRGALDWT